MERWLLRLWHFFAGHPHKGIVRWGSVLEGATCRCGVTFYLWDLYP